MAARDAFPAAFICPRRSSRWEASRLRRVWREIAQAGHLPGARPAATLFAILASIVAALAGEEKVMKHRPWRPYSHAVEHDARLPSAGSVRPRWSASSRRSGATKAPSRPVLLCADSSVAAAAPFIRPVVTGRRCRALPRPPGGAARHAALWRSLPLIEALARAAARKSGLMTGPPGRLASA